MPNEVLTNPAVVGGAGAVLGTVFGSLITHLFKFKMHRAAAVDNERAGIDAAYRGLLDAQTIRIDKMIAELAHERGVNSEKFEVMSNRIGSLEKEVLMLREHRDELAEANLKLTQALGESNALVVQLRGELREVQTSLAAREEELETIKQERLAKAVEEQLHRT